MKKRFCAIVMVFGLLFMSACESSSSNPDAAYYKKQNFVSENSYDSIQAAIDACTDISGKLDQAVCSGDENGNPIKPIIIDQFTSGNTTMLIYDFGDDRSAEDKSTSATEPFKTYVTSLGSVIIVKDGDKYFYTNNRRIDMMISGLCADQEMVSGDNTYVAFVYGEQFRQSYSTDPKKGPNAQDFVYIGRKLAKCIQPEKVYTASTGQKLYYQIWQEDTSKSTVSPTIAR